MSPSFENWFIVFVVVMAIAVLTQLGLLVSMFLGMRRLQDKIEKVLDEAYPMLGDAKVLIAEGRKTVVNLHETSEEVSKFARTQSARLNDLFGEATERAHMQMVRVDEIVTDTLGRVERTTEQVHKTVLMPLREIQAMLAGVRTAFEFLSGRRRPRGPVDRSTADEEMFI